MVKNLTRARVKKAQDREETELDVKDTEGERPDYSRYYAFKQRDRGDVRAAVKSILEMIEGLKGKLGDIGDSEGSTREDLRRRIGVLEEFVMDQMARYIASDNALVAMKEENSKLRKELESRTEIKQTNIESTGGDRLNRDRGRERMAKAEIKRTERTEYYSMAIESLTNEDEDIKKVIRDELKTESRNLQVDDIIITRDKKLILRARKKEELEQINKWITENKNIGEKMKCSQPAKRLERVMLLGISTDTDRQMIKEEILRNLKSEDPTVEPYKPLRRRDGLLNWMVDVDGKTKDELMEKQRICIDMTRVRITEYIRIIRCYNCQNFGHTAQRCKREVKCGICGDEHNTRECKATDKEQCVNCKEDGNHRSDSYACPAFIKYKRDLLAKRL